MISKAEKMSFLSDHEHSKIMSGQTTTTDTPSTQEVRKSVLPLIKKKYLRVMIYLMVLAAFLLSFVEGTALLVSYGFIAVLLGVSYMMYRDLYCFQKFGFKYRPFLVTKYIERLARAGLIALLIYTLPTAFETGEYVPYAILWIIAVLIPYQFRSMFIAAKQFKENDPTRCEFC